MKPYDPTCTRQSSKLLSLTLLFLLAWLQVGATENTRGRERLRFDEGWRFALGHATDPSKDFGHGTGYFSYLAKTGFGDGPAAPGFDDRAWRLVNLPHDWAVELPFDGRASASHGYKTVGPRFPENSAGWYRRSFQVPESDLGRRIRIEFDGIYRNARVFINGFLVGEEPSGYLDTSYDVSDYLNYGGENVVAVRVDASMEEGWFYEGAGIYRHAWLSKTAPLHVARHGTWVRAEVKGELAEVSVDTTLTNEGREETLGSLRLEILDPEGRPVGAAIESRNVKAGRQSEGTVKIVLNQPQLWSLESPRLYTLVTNLSVSGKVVDRTETPFGVRSLRFDPNQGFFLNGKHVKLKGTNNHQDHAGVGVALPDALQEHRIRRLKEMGSNAYRCSHNPPTPELLDACDRLGMLVIDETRLMGSNPHHLGQLERMILRDRNHPSVIIWSIGNEEWGIEGNIKGARITTTMQDFAKRLDPTRLITAAISGGWGGISSTIDAPGVNYIKQGDTDKQHALYPHQIIIGTEETTTQATRGIYFDDRARCHLAPLEDGSSGGNAEKGWQHYAARPYTAGVFFWTGYDYRGEATPFGYPAISSQFGIIDTCGFAKDGFFYLKSWWAEEPVLHIFPHWNWPGKEGTPIEVRVHSNCDEVELWLNGASQGRKAMPVNGHLSWQVTYKPGELLARGYKAGRETLVSRVETTGPVAGLRLSADRSQLRADGQDVSVITVEAVDTQGRIVPTAGIPVAFDLKGEGRIIGVGNGDPSCLEPDVYVDSKTSLPVGVWTAPDAAPSKEPIVFEAVFDAPTEAGSLELLINTLGPRQTVSLNGKTLYQDAAPGVSRCSLPLAAGSLKPKGNTLRIEATRFESWSDREALKQFLPASLCLSKPAPQWKRSTFNGLAQIIVQAGKTPGKLSLEARSEGVAPATLRLEQTGN